MKTKDGGPAFPVEVKGQRMGDGHQEWYTRIPMPGMSLRDYFAAAALAGLVASDKASRIADNWERRGKPRPSPEVVDAAIAQCAYIYADAMLRAKEES